MDSRLRRKIDRHLRRPIARNPGGRFGVLNHRCRWFTGMIHLDREKVDEIAQDTLREREREREREGEA